MNDKQYKAAFNKIKFSEDFERDTVEFLTRVADSARKKENIYMKKHKALRLSVIAALLVVVLSISVFAVYKLLTPKQAAQHSGDFALAQAFDSENAVYINQSYVTGDFNITLGGIVSGKGLTDYYQDAQEDKSYIVASVAYADGREIAQAGDTGITFTPLVSGFNPWQINAWTLGGGYSSFIYEGVEYYIFQCANIEIFADRTVYLAVYEGNAPSAEIFKMDDSGIISFNDTFKAPHAIFTLPLDPDKANPEAVKSLIDEMDI